MKALTSIKTLSAVLLVAMLATACNDFPPFAVTEKPYVNKSSLELFTGATEKLIASPAGNDYTWSSDNTSVVTVSSDGTVTAIGPGLATITITSSNDKTTVDVRVTDFIPLTDINVPESYALVSAGSNVQLWAYPVPEDATVKLEWSSDNPDVASVYQTGMVTTNKAGRAVITVKNGEIAKTFNVDVLAKADKSKWAIPNNGYVDNSDGTAYYDSQEAGGEGGYPNGRVVALWDNNQSTFWHSKWNGGSAPLPHWVIIDMGEIVDVAQIVVTRRNNGDSKSFAFYFSETLLAQDDAGWGNAAWNSVFTANTMTFDIAFPGVKGRYLKLVLPDSNRSPYIGICEIDIYKWN